MNRTEIEAILEAFKDSYDGPWDQGLVAKLHTKALCAQVLALMEENYKIQSQLDKIITTAFKGQTFSKQEADEFNQEKASEIVCQRLAENKRLMEVEEAAREWLNELCGGCIYPSFECRNCRHGNIKQALEKAGGENGGS